MALVGLIKVLLPLASQTFVLLEFEGNAAVDPLGLGNPHLPQDPLVDARLVVLVGKSIKVLVHAVAAQRAHAITDPLLTNYAPVGLEGRHD